MLTTVYAKALYDRRRGLLGWGVGVALTTLLLAALWPSLQDMVGDFEDLLAAYPEGMRELFNIDAMATPAGFMNAEYFSLLGPLLFLVFGIALGARLPAAEEERGALEVVLGTPVPRTRVLAEQAAALVTAVAALGVVQLASLLLGSVLFDLDVPVDDQAAASLAMVLLGAEFGLVALAIGAVTGRRAVALGIASTLALASYVLYAAAQFVEALEPWQPVSPIQHAVGSEPILGGLDPGYAAAMALVGLATLAAALPVFAARDIAPA